MLEFLNSAAIFLSVSCKLVSCKKKRVHYSAGPIESQLGPWSDLWERDPMGGLEAQPPRKILATTPSRLPENEENVPFKTDYLKKMLCRGYAKNVFMNKGYCFYVAVA